MKRRNLIIAVLPVLLALLAFQSCSKKDNTTFTVYNSFTEPTVVAPVNASKVYPTANAVDLKWVSTDADNDAINANVYFGTSDNPPLYKSGVAALLLNVPATAGKTYYWKVVMTDANKVTTTSPIWSFTALAKFSLANLVGAFDCNEPGYGHYTCTFTNVNATTINNNNFWDSGYSVNYVFSTDGKTITITPVSYDGYDITGTGAFDEMTGGFNVHYIVIKHSTGAKVDDNTHTFLKK